jgi:hypothetical protein
LLRQAVFAARGRRGRYFTAAALLAAPSMFVATAAANQARCPHATGGWIDLQFSGAAWTPAQEESVVRELRVELSRRSLEVCPHPGDAPAGAPTAVVTLLSSDPDRVSIVPSRLQDEGGFSGRTIRLEPIPEDARALAIAQAVDEALRGVPGVPEPAPPPPPALHEAVARDEPAPPTIASASPLRLAVSFGPSLQIAPAGFTEASKAVLAPGAALRAAVTSGRVGGSVGVLLEKSTDVVFGSASISQFRLPVDASFRFLLRAGQLEGAFDAGVALALLREEYAPAHRAYQEVEAGGRAGVTLSWGDRIVPWLGASVEVLPSTFDFRFAPMGTVGHTSNVWLGFALGMEVRWP